jgi:hypothetical protein
MKCLRLAAIPGIVALMAYGCSSAPQASSSANSNKKPIAPKIPPTTEGDPETAEPADDPENPSVVAANGWCVAAAKTQVVKSDEHSSQFAQLCTDAGAPTKRFMNLVGQAYAGTGTPKILSISPLVDDAGTVSWFFGSAVKLPISSEKQFNNVSVKEGDVEGQKAQATYMGQTPGNISASAVTTNGDKGWVRGWTINKDSSQKVAVRTVKTTYTERADHYDLGNDQFMYVSTLVSSKSTIKDYQLLSASLDLNGTGYIISIGNVSTDDYGFPTQAQAAVTTTAQKNVQYIYNGAKSAVP